MVVNIRGDRNEALVVVKAFLYKLTTFVHRLNEREGLPGEQAFLCFSRRHR